MDETWYDTHNVVAKGWSDNSKKCALDTTPSSGKRIIIAHAGSENGWIGKVLLSGKNISDSSLDYHQDMTANVFEDWFEKTLLPALPPKKKKSVVVLDNASYHSRQINKIPNSSKTKAELMQFLHHNDLFFEEKWLL